MNDIYKVWRRNLWTLFTTQMICNIAFGMAMPFMSYYMLEIAPDISETELSVYTGLCSTLPSLSMAIASPIWGWISDIYGRKLMLLRAMVCATIILTCLGLARSIPALLVLRFLQGLFTGTMSPAMSIVSSSAPPEKMSYSLGIMTSSSFLGWAMGQLMATPIVAVSSYRALFFVSAGLMAAGVGLSFVPIEIPGTFGKDLYLERKAAKKAAKEAGKHSDVRFLTGPVLMILISLFVIRMGRAMFAPFVALFVRETLGGMEGATLTTGIISACTCTATALSAVTLTKLGDRYDKLKFSTLITFISTMIGLLLIPKAFPLWLFIAFYALFYFFIGATEPILTSALSEITDPGLRGTLFGLTSTVNCIGMTVSPLIGSAVSVAFGLRTIVALIPVMTFFGTVLLGFLVVRYYKRPEID